MERRTVLQITTQTLASFVVNSKTAREISITIPQSVLLRADRVIE